ncbi:hypothetical protein EYF80_064919 [Liparis tanakae]|uniref:Uncharacterized protein n=1 Tax=Liparis tanakae TaxID=230148 RepID=A0A4Z2E8U3_9TELE|nr:hypothetical protein EYF80_064919 [Liparis tanakae]
MCPSERGPFRVQRVSRNTHTVHGLVTPPRRLTIASAMARKRTDTVSQDRAAGGDGGGGGLSAHEERS